MTVSDYIRVFNFLYHLFHGLIGSRRYGSVSLLNRRMRASGYGVLDYTDLSVVRGVLAKSLVVLLHQIQDTFYLLIRGGFDPHMKFLPPGY